MAQSGTQTQLGKAFEYACVQALYSRYSYFTPTGLVPSPQLEIAQHFFESLGEKQRDLMDAAQAAVRIIDQLEPKLHYADDSSALLLALQPDAAGVKGDVRDVICYRESINWQVGISCKHNNHAVKHSRLSDSIDFGRDWFGYSCSANYFSKVVPLFTELREKRDSSKLAGKPKKWDSIPDKSERYYIPVLQAFMEELIYLNTQYPDIPEKLVRYLLGVHDFYKVITEDTNRLTRIEAININGTLQAPSHKVRSITRSSILRMPTEFYHIDFKKTAHGKSDNTIALVCDNGWEISMRLHNASSRVEPSLKFDVQLISLPNSLYSQVEPWDMRRF